MIIPINGKNGIVAESLVDIEVHEKLKQKRYHLMKSRHQKHGYAYRSTWVNGRSGAQVSLSREVLGIILGRTLTRDEVVDHIDGNTLDNRAANLRLATRSQNQHNRGKSKNNTSGFKGVSWQSGRQVWTAAIAKDGKHIWKQRFRSRFDAAQAYVLMSYLHHGEFAKQ